MFKRACYMNENEKNALLTELLIRILLNNFIDKILIEKISLMFWVTIL